MAVDMNRSTNMAPVSLSSSYFTGSAWEGISMMTLISLGTLLPRDTLLRSMIRPRVAWRMAPRHRPWLRQGKRKGALADPFPAPGAPIVVEAPGESLPNWPAGDYTIMGTINRATMLMILISGLTAGPAVSL